LQIESYALNSAYEKSGLLFQKIQSVPYRNVPVDYPEKLCSTYIPTKFVPNVESCGIKFSHQLCMTCCHNLQLKWQYAQQDDAFQFANATFLYIVRKNSLLLAIYAHLLAPVPAHHKPCHFCNVQFRKYPCPLQDRVTGNSKGLRRPLPSHPHFKTLKVSSMELNSNFQRAGKNLNQKRKRLWGREWVWVCIFSGTIQCFFLLSKKL